MPSEFKMIGKKASSLFLVLNKKSGQGFVKNMPSEFKVIGKASSLFPVLTPKG